MHVPEDNNSVKGKNQDRKKSEKTPTKGNRKQSLKKSSHSVDSRSTISEMSLNSAVSRNGQMKGRKRDIIQNSSHSVRSFASTDSEMDLSTDTGSMSMKRGKRPAGSKANKSKKKGVKKMTNSYDIVKALD
jgi:hypothetical protein